MISNPKPKLELRIIHIRRIDFSYSVSGSFCSNDSQREFSIRDIPFEISPSTELTRFQNSLRQLLLKNNLILYNLIRKERSLNLDVDWNLNKHWISGFAFLGSSGELHNSRPEERILLGQKTLDEIEEF